MPASMEEAWPTKIANVESAGVLIVGCSAERGGSAAVLLAGRFYKGSQNFKYTDFGGGLDKSEQKQPHLGAFRELAEEYFGLSDVGCVAHARTRCQACRKDAESIARLLWEAAKTSILGAAPVVHAGHYAAFVVPAEAVVPALQRCGRLPCSSTGASAIDILFFAARRNPELTSIALVTIDELLSVDPYDGRVKPLAVRSLDGVQRPFEKIHLRGCFVGRGGQALQALSSRLQDFQRGVTQPSPDPRAPSACSHRLPIVFDMETEDPDDVLTLLFLAAHAAVELKAVTVTPGSYFQVSLIRWVLNQVCLSDVRVGAQDWPRNKNLPPPKGRFYDSFGNLATKDCDCEIASQVLFECCDTNTTLLTGGPLTNLAAALSRADFKLGRWVAQGGFAGQGVDNRMANPFKGKTYCRTTNFGSDPKATRCALRSKSIGRRVCVSKNVCHQTWYAGEAGGWHNAVFAALNDTKARPNRRSALQLMHTSMTAYLGRNAGKKIHDPLALAVALDESVCSLLEVELDSRGPDGDQWGSWPCAGSDTWISVDYDETKFKATLLQDGFVPRPSTLPTNEPGTPEGPVGGLNSTEKHAMKLAKKLLEIQKLEKRRADGEALESNQEEKMKSKEEFTTQFCDAMDSLPDDSDIVARLRDLMPAGWRAKAAVHAEATLVLSPRYTGAIAASAETVRSSVVAGDLVDATGAHRGAPDGAAGDAKDELQQDLATTQGGLQSTDPIRQRTRGGRSGFRRKYDKAHAL